ncbi:MAG: hypothetical protein MI861_02605 [Pirellulales bacterium]|nr:hypothetical protein [Pirellulales bacterium]
MVKCKECGLLGVRARETRAIAEAEEEYRQRRCIPSKEIRSPQGVYEEIPLCFARAFNFQAACSNDRSENATLELIDAERDCEHFIQWEQGFTPQEHIEMKMMQQQIREERQWRERQQMLDRQWREDQSARDHLWQERMQQKSRVVTLLAALIGIGAALSGAAMGYWLRGG